MGGDLLALADRVERYEPTGHYDLDRDAQRELNETIGLSIGVPHRVRVGDPALGNDRWSPSPLKPYVTSIDAAATLVPTKPFPELRPGQWWWQVDQWPEESTAHVAYENHDSGIPEYAGNAATAPLALVAACLRARHDMGGV